MRNKIAFNLEIQLMEILKFLDSYDESTKLDEEAFDGLAYALEWLGVN